MAFTFTSHAIENMEERNIPLQVIMAVLNDPDQITPGKDGRKVYQSEVDINGKPYILRVIVEADETVVTIYRTSKIRKYKGEP
jgi:hypothetical protein